MSFDVFMRPLVLGAGAMMCASALAPLQATAQNYGAPVTYGQPYSAPPAKAGAANRRAFDNTPRRGYETEPALSPFAAPGIWQGLYAGLHGGYNFGGIDDHTRRASLGLDGGALGAHAGYNWQTGPWVIGAELDATWADADSRKTFGGPVTIDARNDWLASARLRAGYTLNNIFMLYATGGVAFAGYDVGIADAMGSRRAQEGLFGYVVGGGLDVKLTQTISGRVEALYYGFDDKAFSFPDGRSSFDADVTTVRAGLTYHFN